MFHEYSRNNRNLMVFEERDSSKAIIPGVTDRELSHIKHPLDKSGRVLVIGTPSDIHKFEMACRGRFAKVPF